MIMHLSTARSWRGGEQQIAYLAKELKKLGIRQLIFCPKDSPMEAFALNNGLEVHTYPKRTNLDFRAALLIKRICRRTGASHVHTHDSPAHTLAILSHMLFGLRVPIIVHRRVDFKIGKSLLLSTWKYNHWAVRRIICVSHFIQNLIKESLHHPGRLTVVHSGIDLARFGKPTASNSGSLRKEFNIPSDSYLIANIAAIAPHKDYFTFVDTAEILVKNGLPATFLAIGGDGGEMKAIAQYIIKKGLQEKVILTGFRSDLDKELAGLDLLLFTSKTEGLGTTLLDAFAAGVPVVATKTGGIPEVVVDGVTGLLSEVGDAKSLANQVLKVLKDVKLRQHLVENASRYVLDFSKEKMAQSILAVYKETFVP